MAKLIRLLAASFGGGLVLGAGIRLGGVLARRETEATSKQARDDLEARLERRMEEQAAAVAAVRSKLAAEARQIEALGELGARMNQELPDWIEKSVARRFGEAEAELKAEAERGRNEAMEALIGGVQTRVTQRISRIEEEVSMHSAAMTELRACSLRTEAGIEKLAGSLDRLLAAPRTIPQVRQPEPAAAAEAPPARRRWRLFG